MINNVQGFASSMYFSSNFGVNTKSLNTNNTNNKVLSLESRPPYDEASLSDKEKEILDHIKSMVSQVPNTTFRLVDASQPCETTGLRAGVVGFTSLAHKPTGVYQEFTITKDILEKMATDEDYKREVLNFISEQVTVAVTNSTKPNPIDLYNAYYNENKSAHFYMDIFDEINSEDKKSSIYPNDFRNNAVKSAINKYNMNMQYL